MSLAFVPTTAFGPGLVRRWRHMPARALLIVSFVVCVFGTMVAGLTGGGAATVIVGFGWGGWVTGGTATALANTAAAGARADLAAVYCVARLQNDPAGLAKLASLNQVEKWDRVNFITKGGWTTLPGMTEPVTGAADVCSQQLMNETRPPSNG